MSGGGERHFRARLFVLGFPVLRHGLGGLAQPDGILRKPLDIDS